VSLYGDSSCEVNPVLIDTATGCQNTATGSSLGECSSEPIDPALLGKTCQVGERGNRGCI
jgi:hypothetical protein